MAERPPAPLPSKTPMSTNARFRSIVRGCLGSPRGDPDEHHMLAAAHAFLGLRDLGEEMPGDTESYLRDNTWGVDFIDLAERDATL